MMDIVKTWSQFYTDNQDAESIQAKLVELETLRQSYLQKYKSRLAKIEQILMLAQKNK